MFLFSSNSTILSYFRIPASHERNIRISRSSDRTNRSTMLFETRPFHPSTRASLSLSLSLYKSTIFHAPSSHQATWLRSVCNWGRVHKTAVISRYIFETFEKRQIREFETLVVRDDFCGREGNIGAIEEREREREAVKFKEG